MNDHPSRARDDARDEVLRRVRAALAADRPPAGPGGARSAGPAPRPAPAARSYRTTGTLPTPELLDLLTDRLTDYQAVVHRCTAADLPATLAVTLNSGNVRRLVLPPTEPADLSAWDGERLRDDPAAPLPVATLDAADCVLTGCTVALAETGTIVLDAGPDQGRRALTLIPDHHLVVVRADQVVQTVPEALRRLTPDRPLTWISGPSATSDIELSRVEGVHGPRRLDVVIVTGQE